MQAVCTLLWIDCFETYMIVTYPLDICYHEQSQDISVLTIWDFKYVWKKYPPLTQAEFIWSKIQ